MALSEGLLDHRRRGVRTRERGTAPEAGRRARGSGKMVRRPRCSTTLPSTWLDCAHLRRRMAISARETGREDQNPSLVEPFEPS